MSYASTKTPRTNLQSFGSLRSILHSCQPDRSETSSLPSKKKMAVLMVMDIIELDERTGVIKKPIEIKVFQKFSEEFEQYMLSLTKFLSEKTNNSSDQHLLQVSYDRSSASCWLVGLVGLVGLGWLVFLFVIGLFCSCWCGLTSTLTLLRKTRVTWEFSLHASEEIVS